MRPIEFMSMAPKSLETSFQHASKQQKQQATDVSLSMNYNSQIKKESEQTVKLSKSEYQEYRYDGNDKRGGKGAYQPPTKKRKKAENEKNIENHSSGGSLDIRI